MSDRDGTVTMHPEHALAAALRALPDAAPQPDLWPDLARALAARRAPRRWRFALPAALAAALALAVLLPRMPVQSPDGAVPGTAATQPPSPAPAPAVTSANSDELSTLHQRSQTLERWIAAVSAHAPQDGRDLMAAIEIEDLIGLVDVQLGAARGADDALPLWQQRIALLEDLASVRGSAFAIAAYEDDARHTLRAPLNHLN